jgi:hypothetical protein
MGWYLLWMFAAGVLYDLSVNLSRDVYQWEVCQGLRSTASTAANPHATHKPAGYN